MTPKPTNPQDFEKKLKNSGGKYYVVRSVEDVIEIGL